MFNMGVPERQEPLPQQHPGLPTWYIVRVRPRVQAPGDRTRSGANEQGNLE